MANKFQKDAVRFMTDLLKLLDQEAKQGSIGDSTTATEDIVSVLLRLIGATNDITLNVENNSDNKVQGENETESNLLDDFFKIQTEDNRLNVAQINSLLKTFRRRLKRYSQARQNIKLNRTKLLIDSPDNPINSEDLVKDTPEATRREVAKKQREIRKSGDLKGIIEQDISLQKAMELSVNRTVQIPENIGEFRSQLVRFLTSTAKEADDKIEKLTTFGQETLSEVNRLEEEENLLFNGVGTFSGTDRKLSLMKVLDVLIFLTDRQKVQYNCRQCKFFRQGNKGGVCVFAGKGSDSLPTRQVTITDQVTGATVVGREVPSPTENSCKNVWGLDSNQYYALAEDLIEALEELLS